MHPIGPRPRRRLKVPGFSDVLKVANPGLAGWTVVIVMSLLPVVIGGIHQLIASREVTAP